MSAADFAFLAEGLLDTDGGAQQDARRQIEGLLREHADMARALVEAVPGANPGGTREICTVLSGVTLAEDEVVPVLLDLLHNMDTETARRAGFALRQRCERPEVEHALLDSLDSEARKDVIVAIINALSPVSDHDRAWAAIMPFTKHADAEVRRAARSSLADPTALARRVASSPAVGPASATVARTSSESVRTQALNVVEEIARELAADASQTDTARRAGRIALEVLAELRELLPLPIEDRRQRAALELMASVAAFVPYVPETKRFLRALGKFFDAYEYPNTWSDDLDKRP